MRDSQSNTFDGGSILIVMLLAIVASAGFSSAASSLATKDEAIASLKQQVAETQRGISQCEAEFSGFAKGRH
jgi:hypothetical protein